MKLNSGILFQFLSLYTRVQTYSLPLFYFPIFPTLTLKLPFKIVADVISNDFFIIFYLLFERKGDVILHLD